MPRNDRGCIRLARGVRPLLASLRVFEPRAHDMSHPTRHHDSTAARGEACAGVARLGRGEAIGLIVVDSNRPAGIGAGSARGLLLFKQLVAAHH